MAQYIGYILENTVFWVFVSHINCINIISLKNVVHFFSGMVSVNKSDSGIVSVSYQTENITKNGYLYCNSLSNPSEHLEVKMPIQGLKI